MKRVSLLRVRETRDRATTKQQWESPKLPQRSGHRHLYFLFSYAMGELRYKLVRVHGSEIASRVSSHLVTNAMLNLAPKLGVGCCIWHYLKNETLQFTDISYYSRLLDILKKYILYIYI